MEWNDTNLLALDATGMSHSEIAAHFDNVSRSKVSGRLSRIKKKNPELVFKREIGRHPHGKEVTAEKRRQTIKAKRRFHAVGAFVPQERPGNAAFNYRAPSIFPKGSNREQMTKSQMYAMLKKAVENTK